MRAISEISELLRNVVTELEIALLTLLFLAITVLGMMKVLARHAERSAVTRKEMCQACLTGRRQPYASCI